MEQQDIPLETAFSEFRQSFLRLSKAMQIIRKEPDNFLLQASNPGTSKRAICGCKLERPEFDDAHV